MADLLVCHLGRVPYEEGVEIQERLRSRVQDGELGEVLLLLEHDPVYTLGRRSEPGDNFVLSQTIATPGGGASQFVNPLARLGTTRE